MAKRNKFLNWLRKTLGVDLADAFGSLINRVTGAGLTGAELQANEFSAEQADIDRSWQEDFYNRHQSMPAKVREYQDAGLNPFALAGNVTSAPVSSNAPSSVSPDSSELLTSLAMLPAQIRNLNASSRERESSAALNEIEAIYRPEVLTGRIDNVNASTDELYQRISTGKADEALKRAGVSKAEAEIFLVTNQASVLVAENTRREELHELQLKREQLENKYLRARISATNSDTSRAERAFKKQMDELDARISLIKNQSLRELAEKAKTEEFSSYVHELAQQIKDENARKDFVDRMLKARTEIAEFSNEHKLEAFENGQLEFFYDILSDADEDGPFVSSIRGIGSERYDIAGEIAKRSKKFRKKK